jgi:hypothetical protein
MSGIKNTQHHILLHYRVCIYIYIYIYISCPLVAFLEFGGGYDMTKSRGHVQQNQKWYFLTEKTA